MASYTPSQEVDAIHSQLKETFASGLTKDLAWRKWQLKQCWWMLEDNEDRILAAMDADLHNHPIEAGLQFSMLKNGVLAHLNNIENWTATKPVPNGGLVMGWLGKARVRKEPLGTTVIIGAWNAPLFTCLCPLIGAITAGCCAVIKPPELARHHQSLIVDLFAAYLDTRAIRVVTGGPEETTHLLSKRWNHIFFTGSNKVARIVGAAAAKNLTPTVLELGGQGPCIVEKTCDVDFAARRLAFVKFWNAGQVCISANHVFVEPEIVDELLQKVAYWHAQLLKKTATGEGGADHFSRIINERNYDRVTGLLEKTQGEVIHGGLAHCNRSDLYIHPTVVNLGSLSKPDGSSALLDPLMSQEIFGPILPVITATVEEAIQAINSMPNPLALYVFSRERAVIEHVLDNTLSGGVTVNNFMMHSFLPDAPFGGVGDSGYGVAQGELGVNAFSHLRAVVEPPTWLDKLMQFSYPPYDRKNLEKFRVNNSLGFKRGETMEDQRHASVVNILKTTGKVVGVASSVVLLASWQSPPVRKALLGLLTDRRF